MVAYACPRWRNFISTAPDLTFTGNMNSPIEIDLNPYLIQGANPVDMSVISDKGFQGGFRLNYIMTFPPKNGRLEYGSYGTGWRYVPNANWTGDDSFTYQLSNGSQISGSGKISVTVNPGLQASIVVYKAIDKPYWKFLGSHHIPWNFGHGGKKAIPGKPGSPAVAAQPGDPTATPPIPATPAKAAVKAIDPVPEVPGQYDFITYQWIERVPTRLFTLGKPYIYQEFNSVRTSEVAFDIDTNLPSIVHLNDNSDWYKFVWPDPNLSGYMPNTVLPYIQPAGPFPFTLRIDFYDKAQYVNIVDPVTGLVTGKTFSDWTKHDFIEVDVESVRGSDWYQNGQVQIVTHNNPDYPQAPWYP